MSQDLMLIIANAIPTDVIVDQLAESVEKYKANPSEETKRSVETHCLLFLSNQATQKVGLEKMMKTSEQIERLHERLKTSEA